MDFLRRAAPVSLLSWALAAAFAILFVPLAVPLLLWKVFPFGDLSSYHVPMRFLYAQALRAGDTFLWSPWLESGLYLHAEGQIGMAHPLHLIAYRVLPLTAAINFEMLGAYLFALAGMWLLLRRLTIPSPAAFGGALTFAFGGFMLSHLNHLNMIVVVAHIPWALLFADWLLTGRSAGFAGVALTLGSQVLLGYPQMVWFTAVAIAWFTGYRMAIGTSPASVLLLGLALIAGLMIGGAQLLPTLDAVRESFRAATTVDFRMVDFQLSYSLHPLNLVQLVSPYALKDGIYATALEAVDPHEFRLYAGALGTASIGWVIARRRSLPYPVLATALLCLLVVALVLSLGRFGGLYPLMSGLPILSSFRASTRHIAIVHFALAGLVALTLEDLLSGRVRRVPRWAAVTPAALSIAITVAAVAAAGWLAVRGIAVTVAPHVVLGPLFAVATAALLWLAARGNRRAVAALLVVAAADLACRSLPYVYRDSPAPIRSIYPGAGRPAESNPGDLLHPATALGDRNKYPMWQRRSSLAYLGIIRSSVLDPEAPITQRLAGVQWTFIEGVGWTAVDDTMPRARLVPDWRASADVRGDLKGIDIRRTALVDDGAGTSATEPGSARWIEDRPGRLRIETDAPAAQLLVITERYHAGWQARVDGALVPVRRAYGDYLGCVVPAGRHQVSLTFAPASWRHGLWITAAGLVLALGGTYGLQTRRRRV